MEPLVIDRHFHRVRPDYEEISEEFRHFHDLYYDRKLDQYFKIDSDGNESLIVTIEPDRIQIRLKEIRQFLAVKEMYLAIQFDCREHSSFSLSELDLETGGRDHREDLMCWGLHFGELRPPGSKGSFSRLLGKRLIAPLPKEKSGFGGFAAEELKRYVDFIIGIDENGTEIVHTSDPDTLANNFGANPQAPHYLTAVHFRKEVLDKYYQQPGKYSIEDGMLHCAGLWALYLDNHHDDKVCAWLGDLGRDLSYEEQSHWRAHNIPPTGRMSETFVRRQILAQCASSSRPEHIFQTRYRELADACEEHMGWPLLLPLTPEDGHYLQCVRVPSTDEQREFDELILGLTKILIDSLNERQLNGLIPAAQRGDVKGSIARLNAAFSAQGVLHNENHIEFLRRLQNLRSSGSAHRKGKGYRTIVADFGVDSQNLRTAFAGILQDALHLLEYLVAVVRSGKLSGRYAESPEDT
jgi:hypothetical protein